MFPPCTNKEVCQAIEVASSSVVEYGYLEDAPNLGLILHDHGLIGSPFPVSRHDPKAIKSASNARIPTD